jgi:hypothetical protein
MKVDEDEKFPSGAGGGSGGLKALSVTWVLKKSRFLGAKARSE